ncbi:ABC transporter substrate-binding protein [Gluconacetobacter azotocaptans]|uniref:ABC transporter substrate-binding protein n=1 Tax=Gluconacetobacter azotocaptans TaxID=142834 RepID=A0A7W4PF06_9PROT|nr:ABC transporter substrate-binding protein [Gluconacetobacter azotocaptans]MBB2191892.1 ABC transporter substrate-binding protein [Gluconacetobacter azotocaptans]MBM9401984.1 ABC transporter substrate-binding protein [Gluconacetobacter azotocaptans]GBQ36766.1 toluene transporter auxiliary component Ttg2D [Gluconacetobacter azotocaptans DSM 13594]
MKTVLARRHVLGLVAGAIALPAARPARAADAAAARSFVTDFGRQLVAIVNSDRTLTDKKAAILPLLQAHVDMDAIGRYCLGRYWRVATPEQQAHYLTLFHQVLVNSITDKIGDYRGVTFTVSGTSPAGDDQAVETIINRPEQPSANTQWIVSTTSGQPKVVDVVGEGTSLRLTQRNDYASFVARHNGSIDALLHALDHQVAAHGAN